jgi:Stage II sporulation protein E (SpoIIE)
VIVLTGRTDREIGQASLAEGAQDYVVKDSVGSEALTRTIRYAVEGKRWQETARELQMVPFVAAEKSRLERGLVPRPIIENPHLEWVTRYRAGGSRALLGGDFYDGIELPEVEEISLAERRPLVGLAEQAGWPKGDLELGDDWAVILYTDGLSEGRTPGDERLEIAGLADLASDALDSGYGLSSLADHLLNGAEATSWGPLSDDAALFLLGVGARW